LAFKRQELRWPKLLRSSLEPTHVLPTLIHETSVEAARSILHTGLISGSDYGRKSHSASYPHFYIQGEAFQQKIFSRQTDAISLFFESDLPVSAIKLQAPESGDYQPGSIIRLYGPNRDLPYTAIIVPGSPAIRFVGYQLWDNATLTASDRSLLDHAAQERRAIHASFWSARFRTGRHNGPFRRRLMHLTRHWEQPHDGARPGLVGRPLAWVIGR